jgi:hypothetical protein
MSGRRGVHHQAFDVGNDRKVLGVRSCTHREFFDGFKGSKMQEKRTW